MPSLSYVVNSLEPGAIPNLLLAIVPYLRERGWQISFICLQKLPPDLAAVKMIKTKGLPLYFLDCHPWAIPVAFFKLKKLLKRLKPDLLHSHLGRADIITALAKDKTTPQVATLHSVRRNFSKMTLAGFKLIDSRLALRTAVSAAVIDSFYRNGFLRSPHLVIYNPINEEHLKVKKGSGQIRQELKIPPHGLVLLTVGRLMPVKGHHILLRAFADVLLRKNIYLLLAGTGPLEKKLKQLAQHLGIADYIRWLGFYPAIADLINSCDLMVFPSLWEGMGLAPLEGLWLKCPQVLSDLPALREWVPEGDGITFCPPGEYKALAASINMMLEKPRQKIDEYFKNIWPGLKEKFLAPSIANQYLTVYEKLLIKREEAL